MIKLNINGVPVEVQEGVFLIDAAVQAGVEIPALCHAPGIRPQTSCMICVVEERRSGRLLPACSAPAEAAMDVWTDTPDIHLARRNVLELLLSEHAGDCEAPCRRLCPAGLNIPQMLRLIARGDSAAAARVAVEALALPATLGWVCNAPCEAGCRRGAHDEAVAIRELHRQIAEAALAGGNACRLPDIRPGKGVAIVGAGPAGLAAAWTLRLRGCQCHVYEKEALPGGALRRLPEEILPQGVLDAELDGYHRAGMLFSCDQAVDASLLARLEREYECVILACKGVGDDVPETIRAEGNKQTVRAVRSGKAAASRALHLLGIDLPDIAPAYDSNLGRISGEHVAPYLENRIDEESINRPRHPEIPGEEAGRCLHCDCHAPLSCKLRRYAAEYGARPRVFRDAERPGASVLKRAGRVLFDAGKCIKCGLCIEFARQGSEPVGLAFSGRGFDTRVKAPFDIALEVALTNTASECIALCPTGALAYDDQEEIQP